MKCLFIMYNTNAICTYNEMYTVSLAHNEWPQNIKKDLVEAGMFMDKH